MPKIQHHQFHRPCQILTCMQFYKILIQIQQNLHLRCSLAIADMTNFRRCIEGPSNLQYLTRETLGNPSHLYPPWILNDIIMKLINVNLFVKFIGKIHTNCFHINFYGIGECTSLVHCEKYYSGGLNSSYRILYFRQIILMNFLQ